MEVHGFPAYYNKDSEILILGSFPSVVSRQKGFYYAHPHNRFWPVLSIVFKENILDNIESKKEFLKRNKIALFDVCASCNIKASSDASIKNIIPNDITSILKQTNVKRIFTTGKTAYYLYNKYMRDKLGIEAVYLPSTSGANAKFKIKDLVNAYKILL